MHRTEGINHIANMFQDGPPGTRLEKDWLNAAQEEIAHVIEDAGITLKTASTETRDQLLTAIFAHINAGGAFLKAWVTFDGTGILVIKDSYNVVAITDNGIGDYTIWWDTNFANTDYCFWGSVRDNQGAPTPIGDFFLGYPFGGLKTVGGLQVITCASDGINYDSPEVCVAVVGDQ